MRPTETLKLFEDYAKKSGLSGQSKFLIKGLIELAFREGELAELSRENKKHGKTD